MMMLLLTLWAGIPVQFNDRGTVTGDYVHISDVLTGESYQRYKEKGLPNVRISQSPAFRRSSVINRDMVNRSLAKAGVKTSLDWKGPLAALVARETGTFPEEQLEDAIRTWFDEHQPDEGRILVSDIQIPPVQNFPQGVASFRIQARQSAQSIGNLSIYADVEIDGKPFRTLMVRVKTSLEALVAVPDIDIPRGTPLTEDHVRWETRRLDRVFAPPLTPGQFGEVQARTNLQAGKVITVRDVTRIPLVERNKPLFVIALAGSLKIRMQALAMQTGARGDLVRIRNVESGQIFVAQVTGPGEATLDLNQQSNQF